MQANTRAFCTAFRIVRGNMDMTNIRTVPNIFAMKHRQIKTTLKSTPAGVRLSTGLIIRQNMLIWARIETGTIWIPGEHDEKRQVYLIRAAILPLKENS